MTVTVMASDWPGGRRGELNEFELGETMRGFGHIFLGVFVFCACPLGAARTPGLDIALL